MRRSDRNISDVPVLSGNRLADRPALVATVAFVVPSVTWLVSLGGSYAVEDFTCTAAASADAPPSTAAIGAILLGANAALVVLTLLAGLAGWWLLRRARLQDDAGAFQFLGHTIVAFTVLYAFSIVLIGVQPLMLEVCG